MELFESGDRRGQVREPPSAGNGKREGRVGKLSTSALCALEFATSASLFRPSLDNRKSLDFAGSKGVRSLGGVGDEARKHPLVRRERLARQSKERKEDNSEHRRSPLVDHPKRVLARHDEISHGELAHGGEAPVGVGPGDPGVEPGADVDDEVVDAERGGEEDVCAGEGHEAEVAGEVYGRVGGFAEDGLEGSALFHKGSD